MIIDETGPRLANICSFLRTNSGSEGELGIEFEFEERPAICFRFTCPRNSVRMSHCSEYP